MTNEPRDLGDDDLKMVSGGSGPDAAAYEASLQPGGGDPEAIMLQAMADSGLISSAKDKRGAQQMLEQHAALPGSSLNPAGPMQQIMASMAQDARKTALQNRQGERPAQVEHLIKAAEEVQNAA